MLIDKELEKLYNDLLASEQSQFFMHGFDLSLKLFSDSKKISLVTPVYFGGNYIPHSVRSGITKSPPFERWATIKTHLSINEEDFSVTLHYDDTTEVLNSFRLLHLLENFCALAEEWRIYLDEHDRNDLLHVIAR